MASRFGSIGVLMGGYSSEREISLRSGQAVFDSLINAGHQATLIDIRNQEKDKIAAQIKAAQIDVAFIALHGRLGEDGVIQSILEEMDIPFTGSGMQASQKAFNKTVTQAILKSQDLPVPEFICITDGKMMDFRKAFLVLKKLPFVVKAACEGSSLGITIVRHPAQWEGAIKDALKYGPYVVIEKFVKGRELTAGIFDKLPLPLVEIKAKTGFFDFSAKYQKGATEYLVPAPITEELASQIQGLALGAHEALGCEGFSRVDVRVDENSNPYILEVNTIPGFTETSLFPKAAKQAGYSFIDVCEKLLDLAHGKKVQR
jgi:D-alanine-D-alanine ligase